ncbi:hypothetical protein DENSPDRAFT_187673 [Dentipellis sp. KUC8613]|nr:hypothetical protein DENSPDRAFT_187673 [Dentipellis sp. KUC8613]
MPRSWRSTSTWRASSGAAALASWVRDRASRRRRVRTSCPRHQTRSPKPEAIWYVRRGLDTGTGEHGLWLQVTGIVAQAYGDIGVLLDRCTQPRYVVHKAQSQDLTTRTRARPTCRPRRVISPPTQTMSMTLFVPPTLAPSFAAMQISAKGVLGRKVGGPRETAPAYSESCRRNHESPEPEALWNGSRSALT